MERKPKLSRLSYITKSGVSSILQIIKQPVIKNDEWVYICTDNALPTPEFYEVKESEVRGYLHQGKLKSFPAFAFEGYEYLVYDGELVKHIDHSMIDGEHWYTIEYQHSQVRHQVREEKISLAEGKI